MELIRFNPTFTELLALTRYEGPTFIDFECCGFYECTNILVRTHDFEIQFIIDSSKMPRSVCKTSHGRQKVKLVINGIEESIPIYMLEEICECDFGSKSIDELDKDYISDEVEKAINDESPVRLYLKFHHNEDYDAYDNERIVWCDIHNLKTSQTIVKNCENCKLVRYTTEMAIDLISPYMEEYEDKTNIITRMLDEYFPKPSMTKAAR